MESTTTGILRAGSLRTRWILALAAAMAIALIIVIAIQIQPAETASEQPSGVRRPHGTEQNLEAPCRERVLVPKRGWICSG
jgi:hypothetical protein